MFTDSPQELRNEIEAAEKEREPVIAVSKLIVDEYSRTHKRSTKSDVNPLPENHYHEWLSTFKPQIIDDNPRVNVSTTRSGTSPRVVSAMQSAINAWVSDVNLETVLSRVFDDMAFSYGVVHQYDEIYPGFEGRLVNDEMMRGRMNARRLAPERWFCDSQCDHYDEARFGGHMWRIDKDDLIEDERYNADQIKKLAHDADIDKWNKFAAKKPGVKRREIIGYEIWVPEIQTSNSHMAHGTIFTLATAKADDGDEAEPLWIRDPRPFIGPYWGPYALFGYAFVPDCPYPFSPFAAVYDQVKELNQHAVAAANDAKNEKSFIGLDPSDSSYNADQIENVKHGEVAVINGLKNGSVQEMTLGGIKPGIVDYLNLLRDRLDRNAGHTETSRGNVSDSASATAEQLAAEAQGTRTASQKNAFTRGVVRVLNGCGWHLFHREDIAFVLPGEAVEDFFPGLPPLNEAPRIAAETGKTIDIVEEALNPSIIFGGGQANKIMTEVVQEDGSHVYVVSPNVRGVRYEDLRLAIEPYSMERVDKVVLMRRAIESATQVTQIVGIMNEIPWFKGEHLINQFGQVLNMRELDDKTIDKQMLEKVRQAALQELTAPPEPAMPSPETGLIPATPGQEAGMAAVA